MSLLEERFIHFLHFLETLPCVDKVTVANREVGLPLYVIKFKDSNYHVSIKFSEYQLMDAPLSVLEDYLMETIQRCASNYYDYSI